MATALACSLTDGIPEAQRTPSLVGPRVSVFKDCVSAAISTSSLPLPSPFLWVLDPSPTPLLSCLL